VIVLIFNLVIALLCLGAAVFFWRLRCILVKVNRFMTRAEQRSQRFLAQAPHRLFAGQAKTAQLRQQLRQLARYQQVLELLRQSLQIWRWSQSSRYPHSRRLTGRKL
jgi:hypothetical protein